MLNVDFQDEEHRSNSEFRDLHFSESQMGAVIRGSGESNNWLMATANPVVTMDPRDDPYIQAHFANKEGVEVSDDDATMRGFDDPYKSLGDDAAFLYQIVVWQMKETDIFSDKKEAKYLLHNHGCYCHPLSSKNIGPVPGSGYNGPAVDALDRLCKALWLAKKCVPVDDPDCDPHVPFDHMWHPYKAKPYCLNTPQSCAKNVCKLEIDFATRVAELLVHGGTNGNKYSKKEKFITKHQVQYDALCIPQEPTSNGPRDTCCGKLMDRRLYNDLLLQCCHDGRIKSIGTCPINRKRRNLPNLHRVIISPEQQKEHEEEKSKDKPKKEDQEPKFRVEHDKKGAKGKKDKKAKKQEKNKKKKNKTKPSEKEKKIAG